MGIGLDQQRQRRLSPDLQDVWNASRHWQRAVQLEQVCNRHWWPVTGRCISDWLKGSLKRRCSWQAALPSRQAAPC